MINWIIGIVIFFTAGWLLIKYIQKQKRETVLRAQLVVHAVEKSVSAFKYHSNIKKSLPLGNDFFLPFVSLYK